MHSRSTTPLAAITANEWFPRTRANRHLSTVEGTRCLYSTPYSSFCRTYCTKFGIYRTFCNNYRPPAARALCSIRYLITQTRRQPGW
jgi:hypothetical protein